ncbi:MAG: hypothetical protein U0457_13890 [Candidatus Sericytochromatia bacterium]
MNFKNRNQIIKQKLSTSEFAFPIIFKNDCFISINKENRAIRIKDNEYLKFNYEVDYNDTWDNLEPFLIDEENNSIGIFTYNNCNPKFFKITDIIIDISFQFRVVQKTDKCFIFLSYKENLKTNILKKTILIYDIETERLLDKFFIDYNFINASSNGEFGIFSLNNKEAFLYSFKEKKRLIDFNYGQEYLDVAKFSPNGRYIFFVYGYDLNCKGLGIVYDLEKNAFIYVIDYHWYTDDNFKMSFTKDSKYIILSCTGLFVSIFETETGNILSDNENIDTFLYDEKNNKIAYFLKDSDNRRNYEIYLTDYEIYIEDFDNFLEREIKRFNSL